MRSFHIVSRDGVEVTLRASSYMAACVRAAESMGLGPDVIEGTYRIRLPGGTILYAVEV